MHLEFDCKITNFFGIKMPQPYIEPEMLTDSPTIQEVYSLEEDKSTGMLAKSLHIEYSSGGKFLWSRRTS